MKTKEEWDDILKSIKESKKIGIRTYNRTNGKYISASQRTNVEPELLDYSEADKLYGLSKYPYFIDGNEQVVLVLKEDTIIDGDVLLNEDGILSGIVALKNLTIKGSVNGGWGREWIYVLGDLAVDNIILGDGFIEVKGNIKVNDLILHDSCEGGLYCRGNISVAVIIASVPGLISGKVTEGVVIDISCADGEQGKFKTKLPIYYETDLKELIASDFLEAEDDDEDDDDEENELAYDIKKKEIVQQVFDGKSILR